MINIKINDIIYSVKPGISILDACKIVGITIPRFCYTEILSISGNCRMCLVELEGLEKPVASCVALIEDGMSIWVDTPFVKKARENVMEAILLNHPLDCPICDQGGECDLQDQAKAFGRTKSRMRFNKNTLADKECGPIIKTIMTRCITCTRCVRFATEIAGVDFFGTLNRGVSTEIGGYSENFFKSELSGNVIDLCPVGALTSKPYAFKVRPWELRLVESIDTSDAFGSNVYVNYKGNEVFRVLPKNVNTLNGTLLTDKGRYSYDANSRNRLTKFEQFNKISENFDAININNIFELVDSAVNSGLQLNFIVDDNCDIESAILLNNIKNNYGKSIVNIFNIDVLNSGQNLNFFSNGQQNIISKLNKTNFDNCILVGSNPRFESALLNARIRFKYNLSQMQIVSMGLPFCSNFPVAFVNVGLSNVFNFFEGKLLNRSFNSTSDNFIVFGQSFYSRLSTKTNFLINTLNKILPNSLVVNLDQFSNSRGLSFLNLNKSCVTNNLFTKKSLTLFLNLNDTIQLRQFLNNFKNTTKIWFNSNGSVSALNCDLIMPVSSNFEAKNTFLNFENRPQTTSKVTSSSAGVQKLTSSLAALFNINKSVVSAFNFINELKGNADLYDSLHSNFVGGLDLSLSSSTQFSSYPVKGLIKDFYLTNQFLKNSAVLNECSFAYQKSSNNFDFVSKL